MPGPKTIRTLTEQVRPNKGVERNDACSNVSIYGCSDSNSDPTLLQLCMKVAKDAIVKTRKNSKASEAKAPHSVIIHEGG